MGRPISLDYAGPRARRGVLGQWNYTLPVHGDGDLFSPRGNFPDNLPNSSSRHPPTPPHPQKMFSSLFYFILLVGIN